MAQIQKLIFCHGAIETLSYFSTQLEVHFKEKGYRIFDLDMQKISQNMRPLQKFIKPGESAFITFNFIGLSQEDGLCAKDGKMIWDDLKVKTFNILVDHPLYYHKQLEMHSQNMVLFCLDRGHVEFVKRFYPGVEAHFLPTAGNLLIVGDSYTDMFEYQRQNQIPFEKRSMDVVFIGNHAMLPDLAKHFPMQSKEYIDYYYTIINDMIAHPEQTLDDALLFHLKEELGDLSVEDQKTGMVSLLFIDLYVRNYFRAETIRKLVENGIKVHVFGKDWDKMICKNRENLIWCGGQVTSKECVNAVADSRISLNTMPWFKDGVHDRIFTSMLQGSVSLTDESAILRQWFTDEENICFYQLNDLDDLPNKVSKLLEHPHLACELAERGYELAHKHHTWKNRAEKIESFWS